VGNAVKFTDTGAVTIQAWLAEENAEDVVIRFEIRDTGIGIRSDVQSGLFQAFTQADGSTTRKYGGTGLGLAICRQLVTLMGGTIGVESIVDKGSNFWFTIRLDKAKKASVTPLPVPAHLEGRRILCADNNALNRDIVKSYLGAWGMQVDCAADGYETLAYLQQADRAGASYSLGLIDSKLPGLNGTALVSLVKAESMQTDMHLVLLAAFDQRAEEQSALQAGFSRILVKPIRQSALYDCIAAVMGVPAICHAAPLTASEPVPGTQTVTLVKVLLAEDNIINQKVAVRMLEKLGCRVEVVANGKEAFDALGKYTYDIVFMDCQMPIMDGYAATCAIRERERQTGGHLPIIAMTANAIWGDRERCIAAGMDDYVSKPVDANVLMAVLKRWDNCWRMPIETAEGVAKDR
jgi:CheY-like chemotaxis protein